MLSIHPRVDVGYPLSKRERESARLQHAYVRLFQMFSFFASFNAEKLKPHLKMAINVSKLVFSFYL